MKKLLFLALFLPHTVFSQSSPAPKPASQVDVSLNLGYAPDNAFVQTGWMGGYIRSAISVLKTQGRIQYGLAVEGGTNSNDDWYLTPGAIANYKFSNSPAYFYAGAMGGYVCSGSMIPVKESVLIQGYVLGIQGGVVKPIGKRLSFTSELAVRSTQVWLPRYPEQTVPVTDFILYLPVTVGLRYRI